MNKELADLRKKSVEQLNAELMSARETQFGLRIKHKTGQLNEVSDLVKVRKKIAVIKTLINEMKLQAVNLAYIGDDENDIPCCSLIPFSFAVKDCHEDLKKISRFHLKVKGGEGVINGFIETLNLLSTNQKI